MATKNSNRQASKMRNILELCKKELRSIWHDKVLVVIVIWAFSGGIYALAKASSLELHNAPIAIVDLDQSTLSGRIKESFLPPYFLRPDIIALNDVDRVLDAGRYTFVLILPENLESRIRGGETPDVQINVDATRMTQAFIGSTYIQNILTREITALMQRSDASSSLLVNAITRQKFNPNATSSWFGSVMEIIDNITMLSIILTGAALIREREHGTIEHLLVMPITPFEIMTAKVLASALVVLLAASASLIIVVQGILQVPIAGSLPLFFSGAALYLFSTCAMGIFLGTVARTMPQMGLLLIMTLLPLQLLSGGITPRESMPEIVQDVMSFTPTTHFVSLAQAILYRGAGFDVVWPQLRAAAGEGPRDFL